MENQVSTTSASKDCSELDGHMCRRPKRIAADCHVPGNIPVETKGRRRDSYNGRPDVPSHIRDLDVVLGLGQFGSRCRYRRGTGQSSPRDGSLASPVTAINCIGAVVSKLFRNVPIVNSLEMSPCRLLCSRWNAY